MKTTRWKFWRKLDKRLIVIICSIVIPINILAIILSGIAVEESKERVLVSYEKEFDIYMNREMNLFARLDEWYADFISKYFESLITPSAFSAVNSPNIVNEASKAFHMYGIHGFFFLWEKKEDCRLFAKGTKNLYTREEQEEIKADLKKMHDEHENAGSWHMKRFSDRYYYFMNYSYLNYDIGFGIDLKEEMQIWIESDLMKGCQIMMTDGQITVLMDSLGQTMEVSVHEMQAYLKKSGKYIAFFHIGAAMEGLDIYLLSSLEWEFVPTAYLILQGIAWLSLIMLLFIWFIIRRQVIHPLHILKEGMKELDKQEWCYRIEEMARTDDFEYIYAEFNKMADNILESHEKDILLYQTKIDNLKLQVNPHMLLNSLTTIYSLAETNQYQIIQKFSMNLVAYFRYCLKEDDILVPLKSEMQFIESYIEIQKIRFPGELTSVYTMEKGLEKALIPPLLIQNFVENATKYSRIPEETIEVLINIRREGSRLLISISDTGKGIDETVLEYLNKGELYIDKDGVKHIGVWNCRRRMEAFFGQDTVLKIMSTKGAGTQVWIEVPYKEAKNEHIDC